MRMVAPKVKRTVTQVTSRQKYVALRGGVDQTTPALEAKPGTLRDSINFDVNTLGGYRRIDGYEKYDGQPLCSSYGYWSMVVAATETINAGQTIVGLTSGSTGYILGHDTDGQLCYAKQTDLFVLGEEITVNGTSVGFVTTEPYNRLDRSTIDSANFMALSADAHRPDIQTVPGSGPIRGLHVFEGVLYAFRNSADATTLNMYKATSSGWTQVVISPHLDPGGRVRCVNYNFGTKLIMYGCDGVNKAFHFDGTTFGKITTGMTPDKPQMITAHKNHLFLAFGNSLQHSGIGDPMTWTVISGAAELNMGDTITNLVPLTSDAQSESAMVISTRNSLYMLYGSSASAWNLVTYQKDSGGLPHTMQSIASSSYFLDDRGITSLARAQEYGNFNAESISDHIKNWLNIRRGSVVDSCVIKEKDQYRLFFQGGTGLHVTFSGQKVTGFMPIQYEHNILVTHSSEMADGTEAVYYGDDAGNVYLADSGPSFAGETITAFFKQQYNHLDTPRLRKRFQKVIFDIGGTGYADFEVGAELGYGTNALLPQSLKTVDVNFASTRWDDPAMFWDNGVWDGRVLLPIEVELFGTEENISLTVYQSSDKYMGLNFQGELLRYTTRRMKR